MIIQIDWEKIVISSAAMLGVIWAGVQYLTKRLVDQRFNKRLEEHKFELQVLLESNKFDLQRKAQDFSLYTSKKHAIYAELYDLFLRANSNVIKLLTNTQVYLKDFYDKQDLAYNLSKTEIPAHIVSRFVEAWENNKEETQRELIRFLENYDYKQTRDAVGNARNMFLINRIYLSEETNKIMGELNAVYASIIYTHELIGAQPENYKELVELCEDLMKKLTKAVKSELSIGYYK